MSISEPSPLASLGCALPKSLGVCWKLLTRKDADTWCCMICRSAREIRGPLTCALATTLPHKQRLNSDVRALAAGVTPILKFYVSAPQPIRPPHHRHHRMKPSTRLIIFRAVRFVQSPGWQGGKKCTLTETVEAV